MNNLNNIADAENTISSVGTSVFAILCGVAFGVVQCFFGYKTFKFIISIIGFLLFGFVGYRMGIDFSNNNMTIGLAVGGLLGAVGALLAYKFYKVGVFIQGFFAGGILGLIAAFMLQWQGGQMYALAAVAGIILGVASIYLLKPFIIISTGISGGFSIGYTIAALLNLTHTYLGFGLGLALTLCGITYQLMSTRKKKKVGEDDKKNHKNEKNAALESSVVTDQPETTDSLEAVTEPAAAEVADEKVAAIAATEESEMISEDAPKAPGDLPVEGKSDSEPTPPASS